MTRIGQFFSLLLNLPGRNMGAACKRARISLATGKRYLALARRMGVRLDPERLARHSTYRLRDEGPLRFDLLRKVRWL